MTSRKNQCSKKGLFCVLSVAPAYISVEGGRGSGRSPEVCFLVLVFMNWAEEGGTTTPPLLVIGHWSIAV